MDLLANEPTHHELHCKASVKGWSEHRKRLLSVLTEHAAMPLGQLCMMCPNNALYRCKFYCKECFCTQHKLANYFHVAEKWEVGIDRSDNNCMHAVTIPHIIGWSFCRMCVRGAYYKRSTTTRVLNSEDSNIKRSTTTRVLNSEDSNIAVFRRPR